MKTIATIPNQSRTNCVPAGTGPLYCGPAAKVTFLVTGAQSGGACFIFEGITPPGGGPPPHIHHREEESFYLLQGTLTIQVAGETIQASPGDFVHIPRGTVHSFKNDGTVDAKLLTTVSPAGPGGLEKFFEEVFYSASDRSAAPPPMSEAFLGRIRAAAPRNAIEFIRQA